MVWLSLAFQRKSVFEEKTDLLHIYLTDEWLRWFQSLARGHMISSGNAIVAPSKLLSHSGPPFTDVTLLLMTESQFPELVWGYICGMTPPASSSNTLKNSWSADHAVRPASFCLSNIKSFCKTRQGYVKNPQVRDKYREEDWSAMWRINMYYSCFRA